MPDRPPEGFDARALSDLAREMTTRWQTVIERVMEASTGVGTSGTQDAAAELSSMLESGIALSRGPMQQMRAVAETLKQHRSDIGRMQTRLEAFDDQLALLEESLGPMLQWNEQWIQAQDAMLSYLRFPEGKA